MIYPTTEFRSYTWTPRPGVRETVRERTYYRLVHSVPPSVKDV